MKCWHCNNDVVWSCDYTYEDYGYEGEGIVSVLTCSNEKCKADYEISLAIKEDL